MHILIAAPYRIFERRILILIKEGIAAGDMQGKGQIYGGDKRLEFLYHSAYAYKIADDINKFIFSGTVANALEGEDGSNAVAAGT